MKLIKTELTAWYSIEELPKCNGKFLIKLRNWEIEPAFFNGKEFILYNGSIPDMVIAYAPIPRG